jgi:adenylate cyclase
MHRQEPISVSGSELKQRLAAILAADVVGYSRLMSLDDRATVVALDAARAVFRSQIESNQGRVIDMAGDSVLAVFDTATGAVGAALATQEELRVYMNATSEDRQMRFRIGVHLGDVIEKADGTVYGDGVNIAARLESLAEPGGITISDAVYGAVRGKLTADFEDQGDQTVKNIAHKVRTFRVLPQRSDGPQTGPYANESAIMSAVKPSIAVLPFRVFSDDKSLGFLADGLAEDVIALLARVAGFFLISQASSFVFRERDGNIALIARQLGVRYVVEGSVRPVGEQLRVSTQLTEAESGRVLWSGRFDSARDQAAELQDNIARGIISELEPELTRAEIILIRRQRPENVDAWGCYRQALGAIALKGWNEEAMTDARSRLRRAVEIDPAFGLAHAHFALLTALGRNTGVIPGSSLLEGEAISAAELAISLGDDGGSQVLGYAGCALADLGQNARGMEILERALELDPSNAQAHVAMGSTLALAGRFEEGIECMRHGMRISPRDMRLGFWGWALGVFLLRVGRLDEALQEARVARKRDPRFHLSPILEAATLVRQERLDEARTALATARLLRSTLTLREVAMTHGRRAVKELEPLWQEA